jgi:NADPH:quinone reductase-like Zn-dependent oxidoreductase
MHVVELAEIAPPDPGAGELAVQIEAAPINPSDLMLIRGVYGARPKLPAPLGAEGVGRIVAVGSGVSPSRVGQRVLVVPTLEQATWREPAIVRDRNTVQVDPDGDPLQLAMLGINPVTAYSLLHGYAKLGPGAWIAQTGASSATARYVVALAKHAGLRTLNVVRRESSVRELLDAAGDVVLVEGAGLAKEAADAIGDARLELILDGVVGEPMAQLAGLLKTGGQIVSYTARGRQPCQRPGPRSDLPGSKRPGLLAEPLVETPREDGSPDLPRPRGAGHLRHARRPGRGNYALADHREAIGHASQNERHGKVLFAL